MSDSPQGTCLGPPVTNGFHDLWHLYPFWSGTSLPVLQPGPSQSAKLLDTRVGSVVNDEQLLHDAFLEGKRKGLTPRVVLEGLHGVNCHTAGSWKDYFLEHHDRLLDMINCRVQPHPQPSGSGDVQTPEADSKPLNAAVAPQLHSSPVYNTAEDPPDGTDSGTAGARDYSKRGVNQLTLKTIGLYEQHHSGRIELEVLLDELQAQISPLSHVNRRTLRRRLLGSAKICSLLNLKRDSEMNQACEGKKSVRFDLQNSAVGGEIVNETASDPSQEETCPDVRRLEEGNSCQATHVEPSEPIVDADVRAIARYIVANSVDLGENTGKIIGWRKFQQQHPEHSKNEWKAIYESEHEAIAKSVKKRRRKAERKRARSASAEASKDGEQIVEAVIHTASKRKRELVEEADSHVLDEDLRQRRKRQTASAQGV
ncbi:hypothetical protein WOLCODRAFT_135285 [Wolfiporia cocos MD-104 SS10]|uniref:Uncharacterized protein n=1 Tax=Wolfiporia cocos (strain MD-104) TaxID=742152 RepID=A0A2H3IUT1_WOLCO|nr:hypothetical protein WOLCODRAFT_135285 [Wolfiporia cocos MD-104 SS10]